MLEVNDTYCNEIRTDPEVYQLTYKLEDYQKIKINMSVFYRTNFLIFFNFKYDYIIIHSA